MTLTKRPQNGLVIVVVHMKYYGLSHHHPLTPADTLVGGLLAVHYSGSKLPLLGLPYLTPDLGDH